MYLLTDNVQNEYICFVFMKCISIIIVIINTMDMFAA